MLFCAFVRLGKQREGRSEGSAQSLDPFGVSRGWGFKMRKGVGMEGVADDDTISHYH